MTAEEIIAALKLQPHPEGATIARTWRDEAPEGDRGHGTAIYDLLRAGERSHWHRVDAAEIWRYHAGAPLELRFSEDGTTRSLRRVLGIELLKGQRPQILIPPHLAERLVLGGVDPRQLHGVTRLRALKL